jgi:hypothetical protein
MITRVFWYSSKGLARKEPLYRRITCRRSSFFYIEFILEDFGTHTYTLGLEFLFMEDSNLAYGHKFTYNYCA